MRQVKLQCTIDWRLSVQCGLRFIMFFTTKLCRVQSCCVAASSNTR